MQMHSNALDIQQSRFDQQINQKRAGSGSRYTGTKKQEQDISLCICYCNSVYGSHPADSIAQQ